MAAEKQNEQQEQDELRDLDVPEEQAEDVAGGNVAAARSNMTPWTTTHDSGGR